MFVVASPVDADAPLASARDTPAIRRPRKSGSMHTTPTTRLRGSGCRRTSQPPLHLKDDFARKTFCAPVEVHFTL
jgi:hypothetical protein